MNIPNNIAVTMFYQLVQRNEVYCFSCSECPSGTCGYNCSQKCSQHCLNAIGDIFSDIDVCPNGCQAGYTKEACTEGICYSSLWIPS